LQTAIAEEIEIAKRVQPLPVIDQRFSFVASADAAVQDVPAAPVGEQQLPVHYNKQFHKRKFVRRPNGRTKLKVSESFLGL